MARSSSIVRALPSTVDAKPHCPEMHSRSMSTYLAASSTRRLSVSLDSSSGVLVVITPSTTTWSSGTKRSGSNVPDRSSSYSRNSPSTLSPPKTSSATKSYPPEENHAER